MEVVTFPSGRNGSLTGLSGRVSSVARWSDTTVSSSGGGGYVHPTYGGHVSAPKITSSVVDRQEFWLETHGQEQHQFNLNIPLANDHKVCLIWSNVEGRSELIYWNNYSSRRHSLITQDAPHILLSDNDALEARKAFLVTLALTVAAFFALTNHMNGDFAAEFSIALFFGTPVGLVIGLIVRRMKRMQAMQRNVPTLTQLCERTSDRIQGFTH